MISIGAAVFLNLCITGIFAFAGFALPTERLFPNSYYHVYKPKLLKKICKLMNIDAFRAFLLATVWRNRDQQKKYFDGTKSGIDNLIVQSKKSEFGHLIPFILILLLSAYVLYLGKWKIALTTTLINVIFNLYPIFLQRHHRMRIQRLADRFMK